MSNRMMLCHDSFLMLCDSCFAQPFVIPKSISNRKLPNSLERWFTVLSTDELSLVYADHSALVFNLHLMNPNPCTCRTLLLDSIIWIFLRVRTTHPARTPIPQWIYILHDTRGYIHTHTQPTHTENSNVEYNWKWCRHWRWKWNIAWALHTAPAWTAWIIFAYRMIDFMSNFVMLLTQPITTWMIIRPSVARSMTMHWEQSWRHVWNVTSVSFVAGCSNHSICEN